MLMRTGFAVLLLAASGLAGCYSKATAYDGRFTVAYAGPLASVENFVKPIAPGAKLDLAVFANGTTDELGILEVVSSKPNVLRVASIHGELLTVQGVSPGTAELTITVKDGDGKRVTDKMFFHVAKPATHGLAHICTEEPKAAYLKGSDVVVFHSLATTDKRPIIGYDYRPLTVSPAPALEFVVQPQTANIYRYRAAQTNADVTVKSNIDGKTISVRVIEPSEIERATLYGPETMLTGNSSYAFGHLELADGTDICSQNALTRAKSLSPDVCKVTAKLEDSLDDSNREQLAVIDALRFGTCELEMTFPELGDRGLVLRRSIKVGRVEYPSDKRESSPRPSWPLWTFLGLAQLVAIGMLVRSRRAAR